MAPGEAEIDMADSGVVWEDLPAPPGWKKKVAQRKGGTPKRGGIMFNAPNGEEIKTKRQLERYLKNNSGGPPLSDFDWSTGETPRRSERLSCRKRPSNDVATVLKRGKKKKARAVRKPKNKGAEEEEDEEEEEKKEEEGEEEGEEKKEEDENETIAAAEEVKEEEKKIVEEGEGDAGEEEDDDDDNEDEEVKEKRKGANKKKNVEALSCAKTETLAKSQEAQQPAQIGVSS